jgi:hypothetical protein
MVTLAPSATVPTALWPVPGPDRTVSGEPAVLTVPDPVLPPAQALSLVYVRVPQ